MAPILVDNNFEDEVAVELSALGYSLTLARSIGMAQFPDDLILSTATSLGWIVLTHDRDFIALHKSGIAHAGIVFTSVDADFPALATRIHLAVFAAGSLVGRLVRIYRPA